MFSKEELQILLEAMCYYNNDKLGDEEKVLNLISKLEQEIEWEQNLKIPL